MNITEANAVNVVLDWISSLTMFEQAAGCDIDDALLIDRVDILARQANKALHAGPSPREVVERIRRVLADEPCEWPGDLEHDHRACLDDVRATSLVTP